MKSVETALLEWVDVFEQMKIRYAIMGGLAVRVHGIPRPTHDVDLTISIDRQELPALFANAKGLGYSVPDAYHQGWVDRIAGMPLLKFRAYLDSGHGLDVDLFIAESPFQHSLLERRIHLPWNGRTLAIVSPEDLVLLKLIANRPRDIADVGDILFTQGTLDEAYMRRWAAQLGVADRLAASLEDPPL